MVVKRIEVELSEFSMDEIISYVKDHDEWPLDRSIGDFSDDDIIEAVAHRGIKIAPDGDNPVQDAPSLNDAVDQCRWGNIGLCAHYLIRAIPGLWPLGKILGA
jgi:hypothetical protein